MPQATSRDGTTIEYDDSGSGDEAYLLLTGWCDTRAVFDRLAPRLAPRRVLRLDWRGHGGSGPAPRDFGVQELVEDALAVVEASGAARVIPVAQAHAGWVALELRRSLGPRVPSVGLLSWIVLEAPPPFVDALRGMAAPATARAAVEKLTGMWVDGVDDPAVVRHVRERMAPFPDGLWARAAREILASYAKHGSPLAALAALDAPPRTLHLYSQPAAPEYLAAQHAFAAAHPWFEARRLPGRSHFPSIESAEEVAAALRSLPTA